MRKTLILLFTVISTCYCGAQTVLTESFENWLSSGWTVDPSVEKYGWKQSEENCKGSFGPGEAYDGSYAASMNMSSAPLNVECDIVSPEFDVSGMKNPELSFAYFYKRTSDSDPFKIEVYAGYKRNGKVEFETLAWAEPENGMSEWDVFSRVINRNVVQVKIRVCKTAGATFRPVYMDNLIVKEGPSVASPVDLSYSFVTGEDGKVDIAWHAINDENEWNLKLSDKKIDPNTEKATVETQVSGSPSYAATGLIPGTDYYVYVQTVSGAETSEWAELTFKMEYAPVELPLTIDFESDNGKFMYAQDNQTNAWAWGEAAGGTGKSIYVSDDGGISNSYSNVTSMSYIYKTVVFPQDMPNGAFLSFDFKGIGSTPNHVMEAWLMENLSVYPKAGSFMNASNAKSTKLGSAYGKEEWDNMRFEIPASFSGKTVRLVIGWRNNDYQELANPPAAIDNIKIGLLDFLTPQNLKVETVTENSVTLSWEERGVATEWEVEYGKYDFVPGQGTVVKVSKTPQFTVTGLDDCSQYAFMVRSSNGDRHGEYSEKVVVATKSNEKTAPYSYNFDDITTEMFPAGWSFITNRQESKPWILSGQPNYYHSAPNCIGIINIDGKNQMMLISPPFSDLSNKDKRVTFYANIQVMQSLIVGVMSNPEDPNSFVELKTLRGADFGETTYRHILYLNSDLITPDHKYVAFKIGTVNQKPVLIDDFVYEQLPELIEPAGLRVLDIDDVKVRLTWKVQGKENKWETALGDDKFIPEDNAEYEQTNVPMSVYDNLTAGTAYRAYVRAVGQDGKKGPWSESYYFRTSLADENVLPFMENFDNQGIYGMVPLKWKVLDYNTLWGLTRDDNASSAPNCLAYATSEEKIIDDWLFTPNFKLDKGYEYLFSCRVKADAENNCSLSLHYGENPDAESMSEAVLSENRLPAQYKLVKVRFVPRETGYYHIGINTKGVLNEAMWLDDVLLQNEGAAGIGSVEGDGESSVRLSVREDALYVECPDGLTDAKVSVYNMAGIKVKDADLTSSVARISVHGLMPGSYVVKVSADGYSSVHKIAIFR